MTDFKRGIYCIECATSYDAREGKKHIRNNPSHHTSPVEFQPTSVPNTTGKVVGRTNTYKQKVEAYLASNGKWDFFKKVIENNKKASIEWETGEALTEGQFITKTIARLVKDSTTNVISGIDAIELTPSATDVDLEEAKDTAKALIDAEREIRKFSNVIYNGIEFQAKEWDIIMIMSLISKTTRGYDLPTDDYWRTANNTNVNLKSNDLDNLDNIIREQIQNAYLWSWIKKAEIDACTTVAEVEAVDLELSA